MEFQLARPDGRLAPWVAAAVHVSFDAPGRDLLPCHFPALVEGGLTVVLEGALFAPGPAGPIALPAAMVSTASALPMTLWRTPRLRCAGLRLQPAGAQALLQSSPAGLAQPLADAADVVGPAWAGVHAQLADAASPPEALRRLLAFAAARLCTAPHAQRAGRALQLQQAALRCAAPAEALGLSVRQFERRFLATFGLRPKLFQRVARVEAVLRDAVRERRTDADIALRHGFYDQSHLARDLRALAGAPLRTLLAAVQAPDTPHWALAIGAGAAPARPADRMSHSS